MSTSLLCCIPLPVVGAHGLIVALALAGGAVASAADGASTADARRLLDAGKFEQARAALEPIVAAEPKNAEAVCYLGWAELRLNQPEQAVTTLERAVALDGTRSLYFQVLGDACGQMTQQASFFAKPGWARKCLTAYSKAVALDPDNLDARAARMGYYWHAPAIAGGGMDKAYAEAGEIRRRDAVRGAQALADLYVSDKKFAEAFAAVDELITKNPENMPARYQLGRLCAITGQQLDRGAAALQAYLQYQPQGKEPGIAPAHWRLGMIQEKRGDPAAARAEYEAALQLAPDFAAARDALAKLR